MKKLPRRGSFFNEEEMEKGKGLKVKKILIIVKEK